jgi:hypothetical protein
MRFNLALITTTLFGMTLASPTACGSNLKVLADRSANNATLVLNVNGGKPSPPPLPYAFTSKQKC